MDWVGWIGGRLRCSLSSNAEAIVLSKFNAVLKVLSLAEESTWLYAWGGDNDFEQHTNRGAFDISLLTGEVTETEAEASDKEYAHAM